MKGIKNLLGGLILVAILIILDREIGQEEPMKNRTTRKLWLAVALILAFVATCFGGVMSAQQTPIFYGALRPGILGQTVCNKKEEVAIIINDGYDFDSVGLARVVAHEMHHAATIKRLGGCLKAAEVYKADPMTQEIPAYCMELKERMRESTEPGAVLQDFIRHIYNVYGIPKKMSPEQVARRVEELCTGRSHDSS